MWNLSDKPVLLWLPDVPAANIHSRVQIYPNLAVNKATIGVIAIIDITLVLSQGHLRDGKSHDQQWQSYRLYVGQKLFYIICAVTI